MKLILAIGAGSFIGGDDGSEVKLSAQGWKDMNGA